MRNYFPGDMHAKADTFARICVNGELPADQVCALAHMEKPETIASLVILSGIKADTVVGDLEHYRAIGFSQLRLDDRRRGVFLDVGKSFLNNTIESGFEGRLQSVV